MAQFRQVTREEVDQMDGGRAKGVGDQRREAAELYRSSLSQFGPGAWVEVMVDEGEKRDTVKNRLKRAADDLGLSLAFRRTRGSHLRFRITAADNVQ